MLSRVFIFCFLCSFLFSYQSLVYIVVIEIKILTDEQVDWSTKVNCLKRIPVTVARQIDYVFKQLWGKVILSGMHPIGQILKFDD